MFYSQSPFSKKGPLEAIKIAAYFFKRLKKSQVKATDISSSVDKILEDEEQLIRVLGYLLLGTVRIYSKKVEYLLYDCQEVLLETNNFVVHTREDLPRETQRAPYFSVTLPDTYDLDAFNLDVLEDAFDDNVLPIEEITLKERTSENAGAKQHALDLCLYEDIAGSCNPCSAMYTPFEDILSTYGIDVNLRKLLNIDGLTTTMEIIQEHGFSQRKQVDCVVLSPIDEDLQNIYMTRNEENQYIIEKAKDTEILSSNQGMVQDSEESDVNLVKPNDKDSQVDRDQSMVSEPEQMGYEMCQVNSQEPEIEKFRVYSEDSRVDRDQSMVSEPEQMGYEMCQVNSHEPEIEKLRVYTEDFRVDRNQSMVSEPEQVGHEMCQVNSQEPEIEKFRVYGEDSRVDRDQSMVSEPKQMGHEMCQVNSQEPEIAMFRVYTRSRGKSVNRSILCEPKETQEPIDSFSEENCKDREIILTEVPDNGESCNNGTREDKSRSKKKSNPDIEIPDASGVGLTTPRLVGIATPTPKERARSSRKRKCVIDEATYLPNKVMKEMIHDATDLVSKRRKVAHTVLDIWRAARSYPHHFFDPVLTGISPDLRSLFYGEKLKMPKLSSKTMAPPEKLEVTNISISGLSEPIGISPETPVRCSADISEQIINIAPETPVQQQSTIARAFDIPMSPGTPNCESVRPFMTDSPRLEPSPSFDRQPDLINLMGEVVSSYPEDSSEWDGWSVRTRAVARYFRGIFQKLKEREEEETLNLSMAVEGKSKKESARLFFEVLVLSSKGFVGVKQEKSYGDISVAKLEKFDQSCGVEE